MGHASEDDFESLLKAVEVARQLGEEGIDVINYHWKTIKFDEPAPLLISPSSI